MSINKQMDKQNVAYPHNEVLFSLKERKEVRIHTTTLIHHENFMLRERS